MCRPFLFMRKKDFEQFSALPHKEKELFVQMTDRRDHHRFVLWLAFIFMSGICALFTLYMWMSDGKACLVENIEVAVGGGVTLVIGFLLGRSWQTLNTIGSSMKR